MNKKSSLKKMYKSVRKEESGRKEKSEKKNIVGNWKNNPSICSNKSNIYNNQRNNSMGKINKNVGKVYPQENKNKKI